MLNNQMKNDIEINHGKNQIASNGGYKLGVLFYCFRVELLRTEKSNKIIFEF